jgi:MFS family permease
MAHVVLSAAIGVKHRPRLPAMTTDRHALREVVDSPGFRGLMAVRLTGQLSDGLFQAALFSAVFFNPERATSAGEAAGAFATLLLPYSVVGPFAGVFLDRWRRQRVLVSANLGRAAVIVVFAGMLALQGPTAPAVVGLALVAISVNRFILAGLSAALPHVVEARRLVTANSVSTTLGGGAASLGFALALGLQPLLGDGSSGAARTSVAAAGVYVLAGLLARRLGRDQLGPEHVPVHASVAAVVEVAFGAPYTHGFFLVAAFFLGFAAQASKICVDTLVQEAVDDDFRGRVFSFYDTLFNLSFVSAALASAVLLPPDGKSYAVIAIVAAGYAVTALVYGVATARRMPLEPPEPVVA